MFSGCGSLSIVTMLQFIKALGNAVFSSYKSLSNYDSFLLETYKLRIDLGIGPAKGREGNHRKDEVWSGMDIKS